MAVFIKIILIKITLLVSVVKNNSTPYTVFMCLSKIKSFSGVHFSLSASFLEAEGIPYKFSQHTAGASITLREPMSGMNTLLCNSLE